ncbi:MAG TPA: hypothetical protein VFO86_14055, partial [Terriglobia bacterium]|nr:hypothetical protein [Terriglobia bacterium]
MLRLFISYNGIKSLLLFVQNACIVPNGLELFVAFHREIVLQRRKLAPLSDYSRILVAVTLE